ncbi:MAG: hypothetical protein EXS43_09540 [Opitutus sp.]|nr:hypothetical protein [Opitutus sp.]
MSPSADAQEQPPIPIGSRRELFVDHFLIDQLDNVRLELQHPQPQEIVFACDQPWEGNTCIYFRIIPDGGKFRMWYQGAHWQLDPADPKKTHPYHICYAESTDGIHWTKPNLGLIEVDGSKNNNVVVTDVYDNFTPLRDDNPQCPPEAKYKALGQAKDGLIAWQSPDGIHWRRLGDKPVITKGAFDSQNTASWDSEIRKYRAYIRDFHDGLRDIRLAFSDDFLTWTTPEMLRVAPPVAKEQFYINGIARYDRAPHLFLGFPVRYVERPWSPSMEALPDLALRRLRAKAGERIGTAITDGVFMSSRDGFHFNRWTEAFLRNGPERPGSWVYGDCYAAHGLIETDSKLPGAPKEFSLFIAEHYWRSEEAIRRFTLRIDGFVAAKAPLAGGELLTKPFIFSGRHLSVNFATSAAGSLHVELADSAGRPLPGFSLADSDEHFGDSLARAVTWKGKSDTSALAGQPVRLRFRLRDAEVYAFQFTK